MPTPSTDSLDSASRLQHAQTLLQLLQQLAQDLYPQRTSFAKAHLDSRLEHEWGLDSLALGELLVRIEQTFNCRISEQVFMAAETPRDLLNILQHSLSLPQVKKQWEGATSAALLSEPADHAAPDQVDTLTAALQWHAEKHPQRCHVILLAEGDTIEITYQSLWEKAKHLATSLQRLIEKGETVGIMLPTGIDYLASFFGVLLAGGIPAPLYPPARASQLKDHLNRHAAILNNARTTLLIVMPEARTVGRMLKMHCPSLRHVYTPEMLQEMPVQANSAQAVFVNIPITGADIAHLQYTSGSTGQPKGVVLTHANLLTNIRAMGKAIQHQPDDVMVSWLPLYHDMGLIGCWLGSLYFGFPLVLMSPLTFLSNPWQWLWAIDHYQGTISGGPNFGYELCRRRIDPERRKTLNLSKWRCAFNGAEMVLSDTLKQFQTDFAMCGLSKEALTPVYGLAECSVGLCFTPAHQPFQVDCIDRNWLAEQGVAKPCDPTAPEAMEVVNCGYPLPDHYIRVVLNNGTLAADREEGKLQFKGPSATQGYYRHAEANAALFDEDWLESGDRAYLVEGAVHLTGRNKDIIVKAGRNLYPHEIEEAISEVAGVRKGGVVAFGSKDDATGTEKIVVLAEKRTPEALPALSAHIQQAALDATGIQIDEVLLVAAGALLKTSSGKIRRQANKALYEAGWRSPHTTHVVLQVLQLWWKGLMPWGYRVGLHLLRRCYGLWVWLFIGLFLPLTYGLVLVSPTNRIAWRIMKRFNKSLLWIAGISVQIVEPENLPTQPCVMVCNHSSYMDALVLMATLPSSVSFVAKGELQHSMWAHWFLLRLGVIFVERFEKEGRVESLARLAEQATKGKTLLIFPEGTLQRQAGLLPFRSGAFQTAAREKLNVVPLLLKGTRQILPEQTWWPRQGTITLTILPAHTPTTEMWDAVLDLKKQVRDCMLTQSTEPDLE